MAVKLYGASDPWRLVKPGDLHAYEVQCQDAAVGPVTMLWEPLALKTQFYQLSLISPVSASCPNPKEQKTVLWFIYQRSLRVSVWWLWLTGRLFPPHRHSHGSPERPAHWEWLCSRLQVKESIFFLPLPLTFKFSEASYRTVDSVFRAIIWLVLCLSLHEKPPGF